MINRSCALYKLSFALKNLFGGVNQMKSKKIFALLPMSILILALSACSGNDKQSSTPNSSDFSGHEAYNDPTSDNDTFDVAASDGNASDNENVDSDTSDNQQAAVERNREFSAEADASINALRENISQSTARFGVAYIGYFDGSAADETGIDFGQWFEAESSSLAACCPFVSEIDENHIIGTQGHLYCIIAGSDEASVAVNALNNGETLYRFETGDPILLFCSSDGNSQKADTVVTITTADGTECQWEPALDENGYPQLLIGEERELLSWDFTAVSDVDGNFDLESWLADGWLGPTGTGLAYDENGTDWWISTWDNSASYCLSFKLGETDGDNGEAMLECFYADNSAVQAMWTGSWRIETEMEQPSRLYIDMTLTDGADKAAFEHAAAVSEEYQAMIPLSGLYLLLVADGKDAQLPIFPEGVPAVELTLSDG